MKLLIVNNTKVPLQRKFVQNWCAGIEKELLRRKLFKTEDTQRELTLVFVSRPLARKTNLQFRGKNYATDVLSFEPAEPSSLGELILCPSVLKAQAKEHDLEYEEELGYMILHGLLHLLGFEHEATPAKAKEMFSLQDEIFKKLLG